MLLQLMQYAQSAVIVSTILRSTLYLHSHGKEFDGSLRLRRLPRRARSTSSSLSQSLSAMELEGGAQLR